MTTQPQERTHEVTRVDNGLRHVFCAFCCGGFRTKGTYQAHCGTIAYKRGIPWSGNTDCVVCADIARVGVFPCGHGEHR